MKSLEFIVLLLSFMAVTTSVSARPAYHSRARVSVAVGVGVGLGIAAHHHYGHAVRSYGYGVRYYPNDYYWGYYPGVVIAPAVSYSVQSVPVYNTSITTGTTVYGETYQPAYGNDNYQYSNNVVSEPSLNPANYGGKDWLYCHQPDGFYPAIKSCPGGWQRVPAQGAR